MSGDRVKRRTVADNSVGPRVMRRFGGVRQSVDLRVDIRKERAEATLKENAVSNGDAAPASVNHDEASHDGAAPRKRRAISRHA